MGMLQLLPDCAGHSKACTISGLTVSTTAAVARSIHVDRSHRSTAHRTSRRGTKGVGWMRTLDAQPRARLKVVVRGKQLDSRIALVATRECDRITQAEQPHLRADAMPCCRTLPMSTHGGSGAVGACGSPR